VARIADLSTFIWRRKSFDRFYQSKDGKMEKTFDALEWLAAMGPHVPDKGRADY
jgi:hypothetical protein